MKSESHHGIPESKLTVPVAGRDHIQGPTDAPIMLLEYGDYECPYCAEADPVVKALQEELGDQLCYAYRNFPLTNVHPHAAHASEAAEAADAQGHFWEMHDLLFENQQNLEDEDLAEYASTLGLNAERLVEEVRKGAHAARIREDVRAGDRAGVDGTPTFFINGVLYEGEIDPNEMLLAMRERIER